MTAPGSQTLTNIQFAHEATFGVANARARKFYGVSTGALDTGLTWAFHNQENRGIKTRTSRAGTIVREAPTFKLSDIDGIGFDDLVMPFCIGLQSGTSPAGAGDDKTWTFTPSQTAANFATDASICLDIGDDIQNYVVAGAVPTSWTLSATAGESTKFSMDLVGTSVAKGAATALANVDPIYIPGGLWTVAFHNDWAGLAAETPSPSFVRSFSLTYNPGRVQHYYLDGTLSASQMIESYMEGELTLEVESTAEAVSEFYDLYRAGTADFVRLEVTGPDHIAGGAVHYNLALDMCIRWTDVKVLSGEADGVNLYQATGALSYDTTATKSIEAVLVCALAAIP